MSGSAGCSSATLQPAGDDDAALCARSVAGDRAAFGQLVARHENRLRAFLAHLAGPELGDELAQESFVRAWESIDQFRGQSRFASWVCAIGWRRFIDHKRRSRRDARKAEAAGWLAERVEMPAGDERMDLARALALLEPVEHAALVLCEGHGWSHGEAAEILDVPLGTLKSRVKRAKAKCRTFLGTSAR